MDEAIEGSKEERVAQGCCRTPEEDGKLLAKMGYLLLFGGFGFLVPFWSVLLVSKGFSASIIGFITAFNPLFTVILLPIFTLHVDRHRNGVLMVLLTGLASSALAMLVCVATTQWVVAVALIAFYAAQTPVGPLFDDHTMSMLPAETKTEWGNLRVFGAYGWGVAAPVSTYLVGYYGWTLSGICYGIGSIGLIYCMWRSKGIVKENPKSEKNYKAVFKLIAGSRSLWAFVMGASCMGMGYVFISTFLFVYLKQELHAPDILLGISISLTVAVEIPLMVFSGWLHRNFTDEQLFTAAALGWVARGVGYSLLTNPWYVLFLEPLHGFTFALLWLGCIHFFSTHFPKDLSATAFGVLHSTVFGIGPVVGNIIGGQLYEFLGPRKLYRFAALGMFIMLVLFWYLINSDRVAKKSKADEAESRSRSTQSNDMNETLGTEDPRSKELTLELPTTTDGTAIVEEWRKDSLP